MPQSSGPARPRRRNPRFGSFEALESRRLFAAYSVVDLGTLGGAASWAYDLNDNNQVVGYAATAAGEDHAFVFTDANGNGAADPGEMADLGVLAGDTASAAYGINDAGVVVGTSASVPGGDGVGRAVRFNPGAPPTDLELGDNSNALDVNAAGQIVGGGTVESSYVAFVRSPAGEVTTFALPEPYNTWAEARAINETGVVAGYSGSLVGDSGFVRSADGTLTPVGFPSPVFDFNYAWDVNDAGQVVGEGFNSAAEYHAFLWQDGAATDLGTLPGMGSSQAFGVNESGAVVGRVEPPEGPSGPTRGFLYRDGVMRDLNALIPADGWFVADARAINDRGAIAAVAFSPTGQLRGVLLVPTAPVAGRHVFYNNSAFDNRDPAANAADDAAVPPDKQARVGDAPATFANVTSYSRGINGIMIDMAILSGTPTAADFDFRVGNGGPTGTWSPAPAPRSITVRPGAGASGTDRVTVLWDDGAVKNTWLQVTVRPTPVTGGWTPDVFSFGNLIGETGDAAQSPGTWTVNGRDLLATRATAPAQSVPITQVDDFNRDRRVNSLDLATVRRHYGATLQPPATSPPPPPQFIAAAPTRSGTSRRSALRDLLG